MEHAFPTVSRGRTGAYGSSHNVGAGFAASLSIPRGEGQPAWRFDRMIGPARPPRSVFKFGLDIHVTPRGDDLQRRPVAVTADDNIDAALSRPQPFQRNFVEKFGKRRTDKADHAFPRNLNDAKARLKQREERTRGPRLGRAGDGITSRSAVGEPREATKKLGQALQIEIARGFEKSTEYSRDFTL